MPNLVRRLHGAADGSSPMRVRITHRPPSEYQSWADALIVGRIYDLNSTLASALLLEGCAELYEGLSPAEKKVRSQLPVEPLWRFGAGSRRSSEDT
jgi:hypothetical protein